MRLLGCPHCGALHRAETIADARVTRAARWSDGKLERPAVVGTVPLLGRCAACGEPFTLRQAKPRGVVQKLAWAREPSHDDDDASWEVRLNAVGAARARVYMVLRKHLGTSAAEARDVMNAAPTCVARELSPSAAQELGRELTAAGADAVARPPGRGSREVEVELPWTDAPRLHELDERAQLAALDSGALGDVGVMWEVLLRTRAWWAGNDPARRGEPWRPHAERDRAAHGNLERLASLMAIKPHFHRPLWRAEAARQLGRFDEALAALTHVWDGQQAIAQQLAALARAGETALCEVDDPLLVPFRGWTGSGAAELPFTADALEALLRAYLPAPVTLTTQGDARLFVGGAPRMAAVRIGPADVAVYRCGLSWTGPHSASHDDSLVVQWTRDELAAAPEGWAHRLSRAVVHAVEARRATFVFCPSCHALNPPEWAGSESCQTCGEWYFGVVH